MEEKIEVKISRRSPGYITVMAYVNGEVYSTRSIPEEKITGDSQLEEYIETAKTEAVNRPRYDKSAKYGESMDMSVDGRIQPINVSEESLARMKRVEAGEREQERIDRE